MKWWVWLTPIWAYLLLLVTWLFFLAIMHLKKVRHHLYPVAKVNAYILLSIGLPLDFAVNVLSSLVFLDPPRELLLTARMKRYRRGPEGWRNRWANWFCVRLLEQFDEYHCD